MKAIVILTGDEHVDRLMLTWARKRIVGVTEVHAVSVWDRPRDQMPDMVRAREAAVEATVASHYNARVDMNEAIAPPQPPGVLFALGVMAAAIRACVLGADHVVTGQQEDDGIGIGLVAAVERVLYLALPAGGRPEVHAPLLYLDDDGIKHLGDELGKLPS